jgi:hypothetical protein
MANISLTLYTNGFFGSVLMSPTQIGTLCFNNPVTNISRLGTFNLWCGKVSASAQLSAVAMDKNKLLFL